MFIELRAPSRTPPMPKLTETEDWVSALRTFVRVTLGNKNWQIRKGERDKVRLVARFWELSALDYFCHLNHLLQIQ